jgi:hypothetical protein
MKQLQLCLLAVALLGCGANVTFTRVGDALPPKSATCEVAVLTTAPAGSYTELGTIDVQYKSQTSWINTADAFQKKVQPIVCNAGGDAVIGHTNDYGIYLKGTVLNTTPAPAADQQPPAAPDAAGGESAASTENAASTPAPAPAVAPAPAAAPAPDTATAAAPKAKPNSKSKPKP